MKLCYDRLPSSEKTRKIASEVLDLMGSKDLNLLESLTVLRDAEDLMGYMRFIRRGNHAEGDPSEQP